jgi:hypothetical protein
MELFGTFQIPNIRADSSFQLFLNHTIYLLFEVSLASFPMAKEPLPPSYTVFLKPFGFDVIINFLSIKYWKTDLRSGAAGHEFSTGQISR